MERRKLLSRIFEPHPASPGVSRYTNAVLRTQDNKEVRFYDDLIKGRQVVVQFMYAECKGACNLTTQRLKRIYGELKHRMGKDLFFYSLSIRPEDDTPAALKHYAEMNKVDLPGWYFLTGDPADIETIRFRLFGMSHPGFDLDDAMHAGILRIINDNRNSWGMAQSYASDKHILKRIAWHDPQKSYAERVIENRALQAAIMKDVKKFGYRRDV
jgi:protein SCO1/2